jgi:hypothetical protein
MDYQRRFVFRASAAAFGGHIVRPKELVLESPGGSALPVTGGRSVTDIPPTRFDDYFSVDSATTVAQGLFEDSRQFLEFTYHRVREDSLVAVTTVSADVNGFTVGLKPRMRIEHMRADLTARSPQGGGEPSIRIGKVAIDGVEIEGYRLIIALDPGLLSLYDTRAKLLVAADERTFVREAGDPSLMPKALRNESLPPTRRLIEASYDTFYATIVTSLQWEGDPYPGSVIQDNRVYLPEFGRVYFGEVLIADDYRRLTMVRMALGSDAGGSASGADVQDNGGWSWSP